MLSSDGEDEDVEAVQKMKTLYQSCLDTDTIDDLGAKPLIELIQITGEAVGRRRQHYIHRAVCMASIINWYSATLQTPSPLFGISVPSQVGLMVFASSQLKNMPAKQHISMLSTICLPSITMY